MPIATEAVKRIIEVATRHAARRGAVEVTPLDVLMAVLGEESRGSFLLLEGGLIQEQVEAVWASQQDEGSAGGDDVLVIEPRHSKAVDAIFEAARRFATDEGRYAELGSEHVVLGIAEIPSPARELLRRWDISPESLRGMETLAQDAPVVSIPADFDLNLNSPALERREIIRALDAAANRAAEGLRVVEDYTRFVLNDRHLTQQFKNLRHEVQRGLAGIPARERLAARESRGDVGATIANPAAEKRRGKDAVIVASCHRAQEALRSLEEFSRLIEPGWGGHFESLRYQLYTLEKVLNITESSRTRLESRNLYLLLTRDQCVRGVEEVIRAGAIGGVGIVQVREKRLEDRELLDYLRIVRGITRECDVLLIVNDRPDLAVLCDADGVHVGQEELCVAEVRRIVGGELLVGVSTHDLQQAREAVMNGADYLGVGPVFPSSTKSFLEFAGLSFVKEVANELAIPWYAIGGINEANIAELRAAGADRIAVSAAIAGNADPMVAASQLRDALAQPR